MNGEGRPGSKERAPDKYYLLLDSAEFDKGNIVVLGVTTPKHVKDSDFVVQASEGLRKYLEEQRPKGNSLPREFDLDLIRIVRQKPKTTEGGVGLLRAFLKSELKRPKDWKPHEEAQESRESGPIDMMQFPTSEALEQARVFLEAKLAEFEQKAIQSEESNGNVGAEAESFIYGDGKVLWVSTTVSWPYTQKDKEERYEGFTGTPYILGPDGTPPPWPEWAESRWTNGWNERLDIFPELLELGGRKWDPKAGRW